MSLSKKLTAEFIGTFWLIFAGCGAAVLAAAYPQLGIGFVGVSLAFGFAMMSMAYGIGHISGAHLNPAVTLGFAAGKRFPWSQVIPYLVAQVIGAVVGGAVLLAIARGKTGFALSHGFASNGYGAHSPDGYSMMAGFIAELVLTFMFVFIIHGATDRRAPAGFAGLAIGLGLTLTNLVGIPVTNAAINPARATGPAVFVGGWAVQQLWLFWVAPILGGIIAGLLYSRLLEDRKP